MPPRGRPSLYPQNCNKCGVVLEDRHQKFFHSCLEPTMSASATASRKRKNENTQEGEEFLRRNFDMFCRAYERGGRIAVENNLSLFSDHYPYRAEIRSLCADAIEIKKNTYKQEGDDFEKKKKDADEKGLWRQDYHNNLKRFATTDERGNYVVSTEELEDIRDGLEAYLAGIKANLKKRLVSIDIEVYKVIQAYSFEAPPEENAEQSTQAEDLY